MKYYLSDNIILINENDNVVTSLKQKKSGDKFKVDDRIIEIQNEIPAGHKIALHKIKKGEPIVKYGEPIGIAIVNIEPGEWIHVHNIKGTRAKPVSFKKEDDINIK